jgi:hypothetical protein
MSGVALNLNGLRPRLRPHAPAAWWFGAAVGALVLAGAVAGVVFQRHQTFLTPGDRARPAGRRQHPPTEPRQ